MFGGTKNQDRVQDEETQGAWVLVTGRMTAISDGSGMMSLKQIIRRMRRLKYNDSKKSMS